MELEGALGGDGVREDPRSRGTLPYLQACVRESHRLTPSLPAGLGKELIDDVWLTPADETSPKLFLPRGTVCFLNFAAKQIDPKVVSDPMSFSPARWLPEAVASRAGAPASVIDHPLLATPFGHGARQCLGSRVARLEVVSLLARFVQDWHFELADESITHAAELGRVFQGAVMPARWPTFRFLRRGGA